MEKSLLDEKENIPHPSYFKSSKPPGLKPTSTYPYSTPLSSNVSQNQNSNNQKKSKAPLKPQKALNTSVRAGDWVCLICNNLNFSFRNECNRCGIQTKKQNYIQSLMLLSETHKLDALNQDRAPLRDLTNTLSNLPDSQQNLSDSSSCEEVSDFELALQRPDYRVPESQDYNPFSANFGFVNAILLTPPKAKSHFVMNKFDNTDSNNKDFPPYKSPKELPSVSPILRRVVSSDMGQRDPSLNFLTNKLSFEDHMEVPKMKKATSSIEYCCDYFNLEEINQYISESFKLDGSEEKRTERKNSEGMKEKSEGNLQCPNYGSIGSSINNVEIINQGSNVAFGQQKSKSYQDVNLPENKGKKGKKEKKSDWICQRCDNLNYSFRKFCNRCQILR